MASSRAEYPSLLLLTPPPIPSSRASLNVAYRPSLAAAISEVKDSHRQATLVVALALGSSALTSSSPSRPRVRSQSQVSWPKAQSLLAGIYSLVAAICAEQAIPSDVGAGSGSVDVRVVLVRHDHTIAEGGAMVDKGLGLSRGCSSIVVDLATFASAYHPWNLIMHANSEEGYRLQGAFLRHAEGNQVILQSQLVVVEAGVSFNAGSSSTTTTAVAETPSTSSESHSKSPPSHALHAVCLGGTFDHLHPGHKLLITAAVLLLEIPEKVEEDVGGENAEAADQGLDSSSPTNSSNSCRLVIGVTGDERLKDKKFAEHVQSWDERAGAVLDFVATLLELRREGWKRTRNTTLTTIEAEETTATATARNEKGHGAERDGQRQTGGVIPALSFSSVLKREPGNIEAAFRDGAVRVQCVVFQDAFGPTITDESIRWLVVSGETRSGGQAVNDRRRSMGWSEVDIFEVDVLDARGVERDDDDEERKRDQAEDLSAKISSTAIRQQRALAMQAAG